MENNRRIVLSMALVAIIAIAAVGIGYAYTAMTTNSGNSASPEYISLVQGGEGAYTFAPTGENLRVYWDAKDTKTGETPTTVFTLTGTTLDGAAVGAAANAYTLVQLGKSFTIIADTEGGDARAIDIEINAENFIKPVATGSVLILKAVVNDTGTPATDNLYFLLKENNTFKKGIDGTGDNKIPVNINASTDPDTYKPVTISLYYGYTGVDGVSAAHDPGVKPVGPSETPLSGSTLKFIVNVNGSNTPDNPALTAMTLDTYAMNFTYGDDPQSSTITYTGGSATVKSQTSVDSSNITVAEAIIENGAVKVTPKAAGSALITVKSSEGSYTQTIAVNVAKKDVTLTIGHAAVDIGSTLPDSGFTLTGTVVSGDSIDYSTANFAAEGYDGNKPGTYNLSATGVLIKKNTEDVTANYNITFEGTITVNNE